MQSAFYIHNNKASIGRRLNSLLHGANVNVNCVGFLLMECVIMCSFLNIYNENNCDTRSPRITVANVGHETSYHFQIKHLVTTWNQNIPFN